MARDSRRSRRLGRRARRWHRHDWIRVEDALKKGGVRAVYEFYPDVRAETIRDRLVARGLMLRRAPWRTADLALALDPAISPAESARRLGRSPGAIRALRSRARNPKVST